MMIRLLTILLAILPLTVSADDVGTNVQLPDDRQIWPIPKIQMGPNTIAVEAAFLEQKKLLAYNQGNWRKDIYLVTYKLKKVDERFPDGNLVFIARDSMPAKGSGIRVKKLAWPFKKGDKTFFLTPDNNVKFRKFYQIVSYTK